MAKWELMQSTPAVLGGGHPAKAGHGNFCGVAWGRESKCKILTLTSPLVLASSMWDHEGGKEETDEGETKMKEWKGKEEQ